MKCNKQDYAVIGLLLTVVIALGGMGFERITALEERILSNEDEVVFIPDIKDDIREIKDDIKQNQKILFEIKGYLDK